MSSHAPAAPVLRLGDYVVLRRIATGGMAEIYLARREGIEDFEKNVVLKRIRPELAQQPRFVKMFLEEARLAATLTHHNIAQVYDIGEQEGEFYFAMEHLDGVDARTALKWAARDEPIPLRIALAIVLGAAAGLHHAHRARSTSGEHLGIVHRDISPSNIFITFDGAVKLMDFGIAKARFKDGRTASGTLKGKAPYMSPEQVRGDTLDPRSDIFSLGVVLYELATTSRLFRGKSEFAVLRQIASDKRPHPRSLRPDLPRELADIIDKALSFVPDKRYSSALEMRRALDKFVRDESLGTTDLEIADYVARFADPEVLELVQSLPSDEMSNQPLIEPTPSRRGLFVGAAVAAVAAVGGFAAFRLLAGDEPETEAAGTAPIPKDRAGATDPGSTPVPDGDDKALAATADPVANSAKAPEPRADSAPDAGVESKSDKAGKSRKDRKRSGRNSKRGNRKRPPDKAERDKKKEGTVPTEWDPNSALPPPKQ